MADPVSNADKVEQLLDTLIHVEGFNNEAGINTLRGVLNLDENNYRNPVTLSVCDELDPNKTDNAIRYKTLTMAKALTSTNNDGFNYGSQFVKSDDLDAKLHNEASILIIPLYRAHLESQLAIHAPSSGGNPVQFLPLFDDPKFCQAFADAVLDEGFITTQLIAITLGANKDYAQHVAYLYERMRKTLTASPPTLGMIRAMTLPEVGAKSAATHWTPTVSKYPKFVENKAAKTAFLDESLPIVWSNEPDLAGPAFPSMGESFNNQWIKTPDWSRVAQATVNVTTSSEHWTPSWGHGQPGSVSVDTIYGPDLVQWINDRAQHGYGDIFRTGDPHHDQSSHSTAGSVGCFVPGTLIRTINGNERIENLGTGSCVLTRLPLQHGVLSDEQVKLPTGCGGPSKAKILVYGLNGETPFFTPGHLFITKAGPKAIRPELALVDNPNITVHALSVGDVLFRLKEHGGKFQYAQVTVESINFAIVDCPHVYGLHFRRAEGAGWTYHANGYLVAANYPEITLNRLRRNYAGMSVKQQRNLSEALESIPPSVKSVFGPGLFNAFQAEFSYGGPSSQLAAYLTQNMCRRRENMKKRRVASESLIGTFSLLHFNNVRKIQKPLRSNAIDFAHQVSKLNGDYQLPVLSISEGAVLVNDQLVPHARVSNSLIEWSRPLDAKIPHLWEHGAVHVSADGSVIHGAIAQSHVEEASVSTTRTSGELQNTTRVFGIAYAHDYYPVASQANSSETGTFSTASEADGVIYPGNLTWQHFHKIEMALSVDANHAVKVIVTLPDLDRNWAHPNTPIYKTVAAASTEFITISVTATAGLEDMLQDLLDPKTWTSELGKESNGVPPPFHSFIIKIHRSTTVMSGHYYKLQPDSNFPDRWTAGAICALYCPSSAKVGDLKFRTLQSIANSSHQAQEGTSLALQAHRHDPSANIHYPPFSATAKIASIATAQDDLPVAFLQTMSTPADIDLHSHSQDYMLAAAAYWRGSDEAKLFGDEKVAMAMILPDSLKDQLPGSLRSFLTDHFSKSLLIHGLSTSATYAGRFDSTQADKLQFWWTGKAPKCLSRFKEFNNVTTITAATAFRDLADATDTAGHRFQAYADSPTDYASLLYQAITEDDVLSNLAFGVVLGDQNLVNRYCTILNALDKKSRAFDTQLWSLVREKAMLTAANGSPEFQDDWSEVAQAYMKDLSERVAKNDPTIQEDLRKEMAIDIETLKQTLEAESDVDLAFKMFAATSDFGGNILATMDFFKRRPTSGGQSRMPAFMKKLGEKVEGNPTLKKVFATSKGIVMLGMQIYTIWSTTKYFMNWDQLKPDQRAVAILTVIEAGLRSIYELRDIYKAINSLPEGSLDWRLKCMDWNQKAGDRVIGKDDQGVEMTVFNERRMAEVPRVNEELPGGLDPAVPERSVPQQIAESGRSMEPGSAAVVEAKFSASSAVVEGVMVAVNIAVAVELGIELKNEWDAVPDGIKAMDIINLYIQYLQIATGVLEVTLMVIGESVAALPGIGVLVMAAGLIMMLVEAFVPRPKPDPIGDYLKDHAWDFVNNMDSSPRPQLAYSVSTTTVANGRLVVNIEVSQPAGLTPVPEISQLSIRIYAGKEATDLFLAPSLDTNGKVKDDIVWSVVDNTAFQSDGGNHPDPNNHSVIGRVYPTTPATNTPATKTAPAIDNPGTSVLGSTTLKIRIEGTANGVAGTMNGQITEVLSNERDGVMGTDVIWKFSITK